MRHGSLFSGIGGFDLAAEWMGWENVFHCEWNEFGKRILKYYWPNSISYDDITKTDFTIHRGSIDILTGGFPCQPYSTAGKRLGKEDERHLWPEMCRAIREIRPTWIVGENVFGLVSWNGGLVLERCRLTWRLKGTKYNRMFFQLRVSAHPTEGTGSGLLPTPISSEIHHAERVKALKESGAQTIASRKNGPNRPNGLTDYMDFYGMLPTPMLLKTPSAMDAYAEKLSKKEQTFGNSGTLAQEIQSGFVEKRWPGLLPTPQAMDIRTDVRAPQERSEKANAGGCSNLREWAANGMLPTPTAYDWNTARSEEKWEIDQKKYAEQGVNLQMPLKQMARFNMLPTPTSTDYKGAYSPNAMLSKDGIDRANLLRNIYIHTENQEWKSEDGKTSQLAPQFVMEMMGFPTDWTELPFLSGETKASRGEEMP